MEYLDNEVYEAHILSFGSAGNVHKAFGVVEQTLYSFLVILHWAAASTFLPFFFLNKTAYTLLLPERAYSFYFVIKDNST